MHSRRGTLLITLSAVAAWALLNLKLSSAPSGSSFTRPPHPFGLTPFHRWSLSARLQRLHRKSFFSKGSGGERVTAGRKKRPVLHDKDEMDLDQRADTPFALGKHKFMTYGEMVRDDPHYCAYIAELQDVRPDQVEIHDFQDYLEAINFEAPLSFSPSSRSRNAGKTFRAVMETQPLYCRWALSSTAPGLRDFRNFLEDQGFQPSDVKEIMPYGLYEGKPYSEMMRDHPAYCTWVKSLEDDVNGTLLDFQMYLKEQGFEGVLEVGKHVGKTFEEVTMEDPSYCSWVMSLSAEEGRNSSVMLRLKKYLEKKGLTAEGLITSGKYSGKSFEEVMREDPSYCGWVMRLSTEEIANSSLMLKFRSFLESKNFSLSPSEDTFISGRHRGKTFEEVMIEDPIFCERVIRQKAKEESNSSILLRFKSFLQSKVYTQSILRAGKYKGKTFEEVMAEDPLYCRWVVDSIEAGKNSSAMVRFKEFLEHKGFQAVEDVMTVGKHKGKTFKEVMTDDPSYCASVLSLVALGTSNSVMVRLAKFLEKQGFPGKQDLVEVLQVGKHAGKTFEEVMAEDPSYCSWVVDLSTEEAVISSLLQFQSFLEDRGLQAQIQDMMKVGKHKGKTFEEIVAEDPAYCAWVLDPSCDWKGSPVMLRFRRFLEDRRFEAYAEDVMTIGKHKGKTFQEVVAEDPAYCQLVMRRIAEKGTNNPVMLRFKMFLENHTFSAPHSDDGIPPADLAKERHYVDALDVGKHVGKTFEEVMTVDPSYCSWVMSLNAEEVGNNSAMQRFKRYLEKKGFIAEGLITSGKYAGKSFEEVMREDPSYSAWVMRLDIKESTKNPSMLMFKTFLENNGFSLPFGEETIEIGLHKGKTFEEVMMEDPSYCSRLVDMIKQGNDIPVMVRFKEFLDKRGFRAIGDVMTVGKHKGKTFEEVMAEDPAYCAFVLDHATNSPVMSRFKKFLEDHGLHAQAEDVLTVGLHKGKTFEEVLRDDPSYCANVRRVIEEDIRNPVILRLKKFLDKQEFHVSPSQEVLAVGKHSGKTFAEVLQEDPAHCSWVMDKIPDAKASMSPALLRFRKYLEENGCSPPTEDIVTYGMHKGKTFEEVLAEDPVHCGWVLGLSANTFSMLRFQKFLKDRGFQAPMSTENKVSGETADKKTRTLTSIVHCGMHKGKSFEAVMKEDPSYCSWVMTTDSASWLGFKTYLMENGFVDQP